MKLEKYIKAAKEAVDKGYFGIQDALMKHDEEMLKLKNSVNLYSEKEYSRLYQEIITNFNTETDTAITSCRAAIQEQRDGYMKEVKEFYRPDGSKIDLNDLNVIKAGLIMSKEEIVDMIIRHKDNPTMLRVIEKYAFESGMMDEIRNYDTKCALSMIRSKKAGETEEKIFDSFVHLATMGMNHPDRNFTMYQSRLNDYEEDALLKLLKAKLFIDDETQQRIDSIERKQREKNNDKRMGKSWRMNDLPPTTSTIFW
mgnify:CR=1 FL=1